jgi:SAM-dependent methyltransferase
MSNPALLAILDGSDGDVDRAFDRIYPPAIERLSQVHWTPVAVARRAAELLDGGPGARVLDVGAGVGKFCAVGALTTLASFVGVEKRDHLVRVGREVIQQQDLPRIELIHGDAFSLDWSSFDGLYFYNPFADSLPDEIAVRKTILKLWDMPPGARVATYHGFGGDMPSGYRLVVSEEIGTDQLDVWQRIEDHDVA